MKHLKKIFETKEVVKFNRQDISFVLDVFEDFGFDQDNILLDEEDRSNFNWDLDQFKQFVRDGGYDEEGISTISISLPFIEEIPDEFPEVIDKTMKLLEKFKGSMTRLSSQGFEMVGSFDINFDLSELRTQIKKISNP